MDMDARQTCRFAARLASDTRQDTTGTGSYSYILVHTCRLGLRAPQVGTCRARVIAASIP
ncbi:hypothetical protein J3E68DRAFT_414349 [Trichoderma sp. SZMC 28012]